MEPVMEGHWEDRVSADQHKAIERWTLAFRAGRIEEGELYDRFTENGMSPEEADEMVNIEVDSKREMEA
jgi:hypothetical protein